MLFLWQDNALSKNKHSKIKSSDYSQTYSGVLISKGGVERVKAAKKKHVYDAYTKITFGVTVGGSVTLGYTKTYCDRSTLINDGTASTIFNY